MASMITHPQSVYVGSELELFREAKNWKAYWAAQLAPFVSGDVLEVGAGLGANTRLLQNARVRSWHCVEPDGQLLAQLQASTADLGCTSTQGGIETAPGPSYDSILYIDVLEHIEDDRAEMQRAAQLLRPGGNLVVLCPAHQWLFSPFDAAIGHYRRYNADGFRACTPAGLTMQQLRYLDCGGIFLSVANRLLLRQSSPSQGQIRAWDSLVVPVSRVLDPLLGHRVGKSILGVWTAADSR